MNSKMAYYINLGLTAITISVIIIGCPGCSQEQAEQMQIIADSTNTGLQAAAPALASQPWYVVGLLIADIGSSVAAAFVAYWKGKNNQSKG